MGEKALKELAKTHKLANLLLEYREVSKLLNTYTLNNKETKLAKNIKGSRVYGEFNQAGTVTGRFSSSNPNLQNIPRKDAFGIRRMFVAKPGCRLLVADYSQIEPRLLAHISQDQRLQSVFKEGRDLYQELSEQLNITRDTAKTFFLAMNYGAGPRKIAYVTGKEEKVASELIQKFHKLFPGISALRSKVRREVEVVGFIQTIYGRKRRFPTYKTEEERKREGLLREAFNFLMQGSSADIIKIALIRTREANPIATVHDEILYEVPDSQGTLTAEWVKERLEDFELGVPIKAEVKLVSNWGEK